jgi:HD-GYP domain-containing protein (c-di-GMP phosphodiesterase class II)
MIKDPQLTLFDLAVCLSDAMDLVCPALVSHHKQVAYLASSIGGEMGLSYDALKDLVLAGALHDIGALSLQERLETLEFETGRAGIHAETGKALLGLFRPLSGAGRIVGNHHTHWRNGRGSVSEGRNVAVESHILHLADRVAVLIDKRENVLGQAQRIIAKVDEQDGAMFCPDVVEAFHRAAGKEQFWLDAVSSTIYRMLRQKTRLKTLILDLPQLKDLALFFSKIIDFRSKFTATHSAGVAASAQALALLAGFSKRECELMGIAGHLHDLGKLAVPREVLEKPGTLTREEFDIIRTHTYHTYRILDTLEDFDTINTWAAFHHERLNGKGYPFHHTADVLSLGSRIMCVADVFTAITEDRPYRKGMQPDEVNAVLASMVHGNTLDKDVVALLTRNIENVNYLRGHAQAESARQYRELFRTT